MKRANLIAFACGMKGSGKSHWLRTQFVERAPRVIHIDPNGDYEDDPGALLVDGYQGLLTALRALAAANEPRWRVVVSLETPAEISALFRLLCPSGNFGRGSLSRAFGGLAVECGECDVIAPNGKTPPEVQAAWRRGRHHQLDLYMATQRPAACDRLLSSQADIVAAFALDEPRDVAWCADKFGDAAAAEIAQQRDYWHVEKRRGERELRVVDPGGRVVRRIAAIEPR